MRRRAAMTALNNAVRSRRQAMGLSQQDLATRCHLTRQAISAIEAGQYVPNTTVALRLARLLGCTVEELFHLPEEVTPIEAEWLGEQAVPRTERARVRLGRVGQRLLAHPLTEAMAVFTPADGLTLPAVQGTHTPTRAVWIGCSRLGERNYFSAEVTAQEQSIHSLYLLKNTDFSDL